jgi:hypothetical protein
MKGLLHLSVSLWLSCLDFEFLLFFTGTLHWDFNLLVTISQWDFFLLQVSQKASFGAYVKFYSLHCHDIEMANLSSLFGMWSLLSLSSMEIGP